MNPSAENIMTSANDDHLAPVDLNNRVRSGLHGAQSIRASMDVNAMALLTEENMVLEVDEEGNDEVDPTNDRTNFDRREENKSPQTQIMLTSMMNVTPQNAVDLS